MLVRRAVLAVDAQGRGGLSTNERKGSEERISIAECSPPWKEGRRAVQHHLAAYSVARKIGVGKREEALRL